MPDTGARAAATSFDDAYPALYRSAYRVAFRLLGAREEAADIAQEACARAYAALEPARRLRQPRRPGSRRVAGNLAIDRLRRRRTAAPARRPRSARPDAGRAASGSTSTARC